MALNIVSMQALSGAERTSLFLLLAAYWRCASEAPITSTSTLAPE